MKKILFIALCFSVFYMPLVFADPDIDSISLGVAQKEAILAAQNSSPTAAEPATIAQKSSIDPRLTGNETTEETDDGFLRVLNHQQANYDMQFKLDVQGNMINVTEKLTEQPDPNIDNEYTFNIQGKDYILTKREWFSAISKMWDWYPQDYWKQTLGQGFYNDYLDSLGDEYNAQKVMEIYIEKVYIPQNVPNWQNYSISGVANDYLIMNKFKHTHEIINYPASQYK